MGAKSIYIIATESTPPSMAEREIIRRVEANTGRHSGTWEVTVTTHAAMANNAIDKTRAPIEIVTFSDIPNRRYMLFNSAVIETEPSMLPLLRKMSTYNQRQKCSVRGTIYDFEDFCIRVGLSFDRHDTPKAVVVEIEYRPCHAVAECQLLIAELMEKIAAPLVPPPQANQDPSVNAAALANYNNCAKVTLDAKSVNPKDLLPFSNRTSALLYAKLLRAI